MNVFGFIDGWRADPAMYEMIEQLKRELTDRYVVVEPSRPELRRFEGLTGTVRTVNMNGRALVEFDGHANIGWYDIDPHFLTIIEAPLPKPSPEEKAKSKPAAAKEGAASGGAKSSAAAKGGTGAKPAAKQGGPRPSVSEILALCRSQGAFKGGSGATTAAPAGESSEVAEATPAAPKAATPKAGASAPKSAAEPAAAKPAGGPRPPQPAKGDIPAVLAWCRAVDGGQG